MLREYLAALVVAASVLGSSDAKANPNPLEKIIQETINQRSNAPRKVQSDSCFGRFPVVIQDIENLAERASYDSSRHEMTENEEKLLKAKKIPQEYIEDMQRVEPRMTGWKIYQSWQAGLESKDFRRKSKKTVILAASDYNKAFYKHGNWFLKELQEQGASFTIVENEREAALGMLKNKEAEEVYLLAHGTPSHCEWSEPQKHNRDLPSEFYWFDTEDEWLQEVFDELSYLKKVVLVSCSTAYGGEEKRNLAGKMYTWTRHRKVVAATEKCYPKTMRYEKGEITFFGIAGNNITIQPRHIIPYSDCTICEENKRITTKWAKAVREFVLKRVYTSATVQNLLAEALGPKYAQREISDTENQIKQPVEFKSPTDYDHARQQWHQPALR